MGRRPARGGSSGIANDRFVTIVKQFYNGSELKPRIGHLLRPTPSTDKVWYNVQTLLLLLAARLLPDRQTRNLRPRLTVYCHCYFNRQHSKLRKGKNEISFLVDILLALPLYVTLLYARSDVMSPSKIGPPYQMVCDWCQEVYIANRLNSRYCSGNCRQNAFQARRRQSRAEEQIRTGRLIVQGQLQQIAT